MIVPLNNYNYTKGRAKTGKFEKKKKSTFKDTNDVAERRTNYMEKENASFTAMFTKTLENRVFNLLPDDKILDWPKLKQTADDI